MKESTSASTIVAGRRETAEASSRELISRLVEEYGETLRRFLRRSLDNADEADDALQDTCVRMLKYRGATSLDFPRALVFRIARSVLVDRARRRASRHANEHVSLDAIRGAATEPSQERALAAQEEVLLLREAIRELPPKCKQVFLLSRLRGRSYPQIAEQMGISVKMVEKHISRALALCRQKVGGRKP